MFLSHRRKRFFALLPLFCSLFLFFRAASAQEWKPVPPQELASKAPTVEADADAEALFWEVRVDDSNATDLVMKHHVRVKIFTERGREKYSKIDIPFIKGMKIKDIMARVIKPDGAVVELNKNDIFEREIVKADKIKVKAKSFAVPGIEPGVIVEYRYQEVQRHSSASNMRLVFQHDIPIRNITYYFKPAANTKILSFNMGENVFVKDKNGFHRATMENVPSIKSEPQMPPEDEVRSWLVLYYWDDLKDNSSDVWSKIGGAIARIWQIKDTLKPGKDLKTAAQEITSGAATPDEQLAKIFEFTRKRVKNITYDAQMTDDQKEAIKPSKSASDTYKKLQGTDEDINELFASLATALGFETRLAFSGDRSEKFFDPRQAHVSLVHFSSVAVKVNGRWKFFDPGDPFVPYGMLAWNEEDTSALLLGYKDYTTTETPLSETDKSLAKRTGKFRLLEDGTLEGTIRAEYTGHLAYIHRSENYKKSAGEREEILKAEVKKQMSTAEISDISIENFADTDKPLVHQYKIRVPNYAQKTGKRMFFQPGVFKYGMNPVFTTATRKYDIFFHYPWSEQDSIEIAYPKTFEMDNAESPPTIADPRRIGLLDITMRANQADGLLYYDRKFHFGGGGSTLFPAAQYQPVKNLFDAFHKSDSHQITLRQK
jgi:hypothetical protein